MTAWISDLPLPPGPLDLGGSGHQVLTHATTRLEEIPLPPVAAVMSVISTLREAGYTGEIAPPDEDIRAISDETALVVMSAAGLRGLPHSLPERDRWFTAVDQAAEILIQAVTRR